MNQHQYLVADTRQLPFNDRLYTQGSLMHIPSNSIRIAIQEIICVAKKTITIAESRSQNHARQTGISFVHPYLEILKEHKVHVNKISEYNQERISSILSTRKAYESS